LIVRSLACEVRFALLQERSNSFAMVFGLEQFGQAGTDPGAKFLPIRIECAAESILQFSDRKRRIRCDLARELGRGRDQLFMWHNAGDEPNLQRSIGIDDVAGKQQLRRSLAPYELCEPTDSRYVAA
jgi:hypothetical protein